MMTNPFDQHGIDHLSPSSCNLFASQPALWVMERLLKINGPVGAAAHRGTAVETGTVVGLFNLDKSINDCIDDAQNEYARLTALSGDPNRRKEGDAISGMIQQALQALRPYGVPTHKQGKIEVQFSGLVVPVIGYYDILWENHGIIIDIKTQLRLASSIKTNHARQVALYRTALGGHNLDARIAYITDKKHAVYKLENYQEHASALYKIAMTIQRFLAISSDPHELAALVCPDIDSFYYNEPITRQNAYELYGL